MSIRNWRKRWEFTITQGQPEVSCIHVTSYGRNHAAIEVDTVRKYPEVLSFSGTEMHIRPSEYTPRQETLDPALPDWAAILWPARYRGWNRDCRGSTYGSWALCVRDAIGHFTRHHPHEART
jgi:hypothetical protein